ncbi:Glycosyltransferase family 15 protein [Mycena sanguinolenta]|uniref:Glycosyltransferase family 15 protein n=1 Tax=Mycena sanguinolenta TaxID=230812 RepID=A0A8H6YI64_9AGAR|nr:Glycosyltransferase family 15 protein [Mycena sanguinolenta]
MEFGIIPHDWWFQVRSPLSPLPCSLIPSPAPASHCGVPTFTPGSSYPFPPNPRAAPLSPRSCPAFLPPPDWIDEARATAARKAMEEQGIIYAGSVSYRNMCRFNSGFFFKHELLEKYRWYWRIECVSLSFSTSLPVKISSVVSLQNFRRCPPTEGRAPRRWSQSPASRPKAEGRLSVESRGRRVSSLERVPRLEAWSCTSDARGPPRRDSHPTSSSTARSRSTRFKYMEANNKVYAFTIALYEWSATIPTLWNTVKGAEDAPQDEGRSLEVDRGGAREMQAPGLCSVPWGAAVGLSAILPFHRGGGHLTAARHTELALCHVFCARVRAPGFGRSFSSCSFFFRPPFFYLDLSSTRTNTNTTHTEFMKQNPSYVAPDNAMGFMSENGGQDYNMCHCASLSFIHSSSFLATNPVLASAARESYRRTPSSALRRGGDANPPEAAVSCGGRRRQRWVGGVGLVLDAGAGGRFLHPPLWSNFEIADMDFWRSEVYTKFFEFLDKTGGFYYEVRLSSGGESNRTGRGGRWWWRPALARPRVLRGHDRRGCVGVGVVVALSCAKDVDVIIRARFWGQWTKGRADVRGEWGQACSGTSDDDQPLWAVWTLAVSIVSPMRSLGRAVCVRATKSGDGTSEPAVVDADTRERPGSAWESLPTPHSSSYFCAPYSLHLSPSTYTNPVLSLQRWGDAPVHSMAVSLFLPKSKIHFFNEIGCVSLPTLSPAILASPSSIIR